MTMNVTTRTKRINLGGTIAAVLAIGLIGLFALMLATGTGTTDTASSTGPQFRESDLPQGERFPIVTDKFAPGRLVATPEAEQEVAYDARCHGEGLMDPQIREMLVGSNGSVASYCGSNAEAAGEPDTAGPETGETYLAPCHGEGLMDPEIREMLVGPNGSVTGYCGSTADPAGEPDGGYLYPTDDGPGSDPRNY